MHNIKSKLKYLFIADLIIFSTIFLILYYLKFSFFFPRGKYLVLFFIYSIARIIVSIYYDKYHLIVTTDFKYSIRIIFWATLLPLLIVSIFVSFTELWSTSRLFLVKVTFLTVIIEVLLTIMIPRYRKSFQLKNFYTTNKSPNTYLKILNLLYGLFSLVITYICLVWYYDGMFLYNNINEKNTLVLISAWAISTLITNRYKKTNSLNHYYEIAPYIKASILMVLFTLLFSYYLRFEVKAGKLLFLASVCHSIIETFFYYLIFFGQSKYSDESIVKIKSTNSQKQKYLKEKPSNHKNSSSLSYNEIKNHINRISLNNKINVLKFFSKSLEKNSSIGRNFSIINTKSLVNIQMMENDNRSIIINFHDLNDFRRLNLYLLQSYDKLKNGGLLIGNFIPLEKFSEHLRSQMPHFLYAILYPIHFLFHRIFPKLPITKQIYFIITKGKNRVVSKAEIFGRLSYCGYNILDNKIIGDRIYFICKKEKTVSVEKFPSYGPIVKLPRIGFKGDIINIYKFRTMHPYSEFIQDDIYKKNRLDKSGKIKNDFRVTNWGRVLRKYFIDEIPQIYNWLRGDIKLIGVRALSHHYFSLYPSDLRKLRTNFKPGLIPPYYYDLPKSFNEIVQSEKRYLIKKQANPFLTDIGYFLKAISNIIFSGARSA